MTASVPPVTASVPSAPHPVDALLAPPADAGGEPVPGAASAGEAAGIADGEDRFAPPPRPPGPGLIEGAAWGAGSFVLVQVGAATAVATLAHLGLRWLHGREPTRAELIAVVLPAMGWCSVTAALGMFRLRCGCLTKLSPGPPGWPAALVTAAAFPPLLVTNAMWGAVAERVWRAVLRLAPGLRWLDDMNSGELIAAVAGQVPFPALAFGVAVAPALAEEILNRGLIGRGLVARLGVVWGVAASSLIFCGMHLHPAQACALIPFAVLAHVSYLSGRSIWLPIGLHFANNFTFVGLMALYAHAGQAEALAANADAPPPLSIPVLLTATATTAAAVWLLWSVRVRAFGPGWREVTPRYELPTPPPEPLHRGHRFEPAPLLAFAAGWAALAAALLVELALAGA